MYTLAKKKKIEKKKNRKKERQKDKKKSDVHYKNL